MEIGDAIFFEEEVDGVVYAIKGKITIKEKTDNSFKVGFRSAAGLGNIFFIGEKTGKGCCFTHVEEFGLLVPVWGTVVNFLLFKVLLLKKADWDLILNDMQEDNVRLKRIVESETIE